MGGPRCISEAPCGVAQGWPGGHLLSLDAPQRHCRGDEQGMRRRGEPVWAVWRRRWRILLSPQSLSACTVGLSPCTARSHGDRCSKATLGACPRDFHQQSRATAPNLAPVLDLGHMAQHGRSFLLPSRGAASLSFRPVLPRCHPQGVVFQQDKGATPSSRPPSSACWRPGPGAHVRLPASPRGC